MAHDVYQRPFTGEHEPQNAEVVDVAPEIPETLSSAKYQQAQARAKEIHQWRMGADETHIPRRLIERALAGIVQGIGFSVDRGVPLTNRLIDSESVTIGAPLFPLSEGIKSQRFWLDAPHIDGIDDWFYECVDDKGPMRSHYVITQTGAAKYSDGGSFPFVLDDSDNEEAALLAAIEMYHKGAKDFYDLAA